jgi:hypothetical protein
MKGMTGQNAFVKVNRNLSEVGVPLMPMPPPQRTRVSQLKSGSGALILEETVITRFTLEMRLAGGGQLKKNERIYVRMTPPRSAGQGEGRLFNSQKAINRDKGYGTLSPDVRADYVARYWSWMDARYVIGVNAKIINTATGLASQNLKFRVAP